MERESIGNETDPVVAARLRKLAYANQNNYGAPVTGTGDNPLKAIVVDTPPMEPKAIADYMAWVKFRSANLKRWINNGEASLALESIARIEGDLQQIRHLLKANGATVKRVIEKTATDCPTCGGKRTLQSNMMPHCSNCGHPESVPCNAYCPLAEG
jgi:hypothetical protein